MSTAADAVSAHLAARRADLEELVRELVGINSQIPPHGDEREIVRFLRATAARCGLPAGAVVTRHPDRPNLVIRVPGTGEGPTLVLNGHVDTKPVGDAAALWRTEPLVATRIGENVYGLGISDMKAAVAAMLFALAAIRSCGVDLRGGVILALVADEEAGAAYGARHLAPLLAGEADACLIGEPSGWEHDWQGIHVVSRGICCFQVRVRGTQMHSSLSDRMPSVNANLEMARLMLRMRDDLDLRPLPHPLGAVTPTVNVAVTTQGGVFYGVVPGEATFGCDLRTVPGMAEADVRSLLDGWARAASAKIVF
ncbi:M20 family metallopeptidase, partial [Asanoa sp. NPDC050611]|uniref:M20 family metallopeptidase n=1 Tax=Asanoa sp. NPDC050611 TaxID=3157098 RepID=UPI0033F58FDE